MSTWQEQQAEERELAEAIHKDGVPFRLRNTNLTGHREGALDMGELPDVDHWHMRASHADYVIFSYATPIAWREADVWEVPQVRYSLTTAQHIMTARHFIQMMPGQSTSTLVAQTVPDGWKRATDGSLIYRDRETVPARRGGGWGRA